MASNIDEYQLKALLSLKDYLFLNYKTLISDINYIMNAFIIGSISTNKIIQLVSANAISFLVTHGIAYKDKMDINDHNSPETSFESNIGRALRIDKDNFKKGIDSEASGVLDAVMHLSGSEYQEIRSTAFSSLSTLAGISSTNKYVMN